jgi:hypothetical protein
MLAGFTIDAHTETGPIPCYESISGHVLYIILHILSENSVAFGPQAIYMD